MDWFMRTLANRDTHKGELRDDGTVATVCGIAFRPMRHYRASTVLPGEPPDPTRVCPRCFSGTHPRSVDGT